MPPQFRQNHRREQAAMTTAPETAITSLDPQQLWNAVMSRDAAYDGKFIYAVRSTGVYCRPVCPSRRPRPSQAVFFAAPDDARRAGFRPCLRCRPDTPNADADLTRRACDYIDAYLAAHDALPPAPEICAAIGIAPSRLRRAFRRATGLTPAQYARARRLDRFKSMLRDGADVTTATYDAGYGSPSRVYENATEQLGMTPASYRKGGAGANIRYTVAPSALGSLLLAATTKGICAVKLGDTPETLIAELYAEFPAANIIPHQPNNPPGNLDHWLTAIQEYLDGRRPNPSPPQEPPHARRPDLSLPQEHPHARQPDLSPPQEPPHARRPNPSLPQEHPDARRPDTSLPKEHPDAPQPNPSPPQEYPPAPRPALSLPLDLQATAFQWRVWRRLQAIPPGETRTYRQLAGELGQPTASRAVGRACATNPVAPIIPCHRALRTDGNLAGYRWGLHRKQALLDLERRPPNNPAPHHQKSPPHKGEG